MAGPVRCAASPASESRLPSQTGAGQPVVATGCNHPLRPTSPLLDQSEFLKDPPEYAISELGDAERQIFQGEAEG